MEERENEKEEREGWKDWEKEKLKEKKERKRKGGIGWKRESKVESGEREMKKGFREREKRERKVDD